MINILNLKIVLRDIHQNREHGRELILKGEHPMVPCLRIEDGMGDLRWLYESSDIIHYLTSQRGSAGGKRENSLLLLDVSRKDQKPLPVAGSIQ